MKTLLRNLRADLAEICFTGSQARQATITALSVCLSVLLALLLRMEIPWWAAISGFISVQATRPGSLRKATLRIAGTIAGATLGLLVSPVLLDDKVAGSLFLFAAAAMGILGSLVSTHSYAWLLTGITALMVVMLTMGEPALAFHFAFYRAAEVALGSLAALVVTALLAPDDAEVAAPPALGWSGLFDRNWPAVQHALRSGFAIMLLPWIGAWLYLPSLSQTAVTVAAVMAVPVLTDHPLVDGSKIVGRAAMRLLGCLFGGVAALIALALPINGFVPWLIALGAGVWLASSMQGSARGVGYVGTQAAVVYIVTFVQGWGPPQSILPGVRPLRRDFRRIGCPARHLAADLALGDPPPPTTGANYFLSLRERRVTASQRLISSPGFRRSAPARHHPPAAPRRSRTRLHRRRGTAPHWRCPTPSRDAPSAARARRARWRSRPAAGR